MKLKDISLMLCFSGSIIFSLNNCSSEKEVEDNGDEGAQNQKNAKMSFCDCVEVENRLKDEMSKVDYNDADIESTMKALEEKYITKIENCEKIVGEMRDIGMTQEDFKKKRIECK